MFVQCDNCDGLFKTEAELELHEKFDECSDENNFNQGDNK